MNYVKRVQGMTIDQLIGDPPHSVGGVLRVCRALRDARRVLELTDHIDPDDAPALCEESAALRKEWRVPPQGVPRLNRTWSILRGRFKHGRQETNR